VVSIVYASKVSGLWHQGRYEEARAASNSARNWAIWSAVAIVPLIIIGIVLAATDPSI